MSLPPYTAKLSLGKSKRTYYGRYQYGGFLQNSSGGTTRVVPSQLEGVDVGEEAGMLDEVGAEGTDFENMEGLGDEGEVDLMDGAEVEDTETGGAVVG